MISGLMLLTGLFFMSADSVLIVIAGIGLIAGSAYREGAFER